MQTASRAFTIEQLDLPSAPEPLVAEVAALRNALQREYLPDDPPVPAAAIAARARARPKMFRMREWLVRDAAGQVLGWYLYYAGPAGLGEAIHIGARHESMKAVLEHLFQDAWRRDVVALSGRLEPRFTAGFAQTYCLFHPRLCWMLVHSRDAEVLQAIHSGDAMLTRLEGEWCMRFQMESR